MRRLRRPERSTRIARLIREVIRLLVVEVDHYGNSPGTTTLAELVLAAAHTRRLADKYEAERRSS